MTRIKRMALAATIGATLALPAFATASDAKLGIISFNHGSLDTLEALGLGNHVLAVPKQSLPGYLSKFASDEYPDAGGLKSPSLAVIDKLKPDLLLITGRQGDRLENVAEGIKVVNVDLPEGGFAEGVNTRVLELAARFDATERAEQALNELWNYTEAQKLTIEDSPQVLVITHNDGKYGLRQESVVTDLLELSSPEIPEGTKTFTHGTRTFTPLTPEVIATMAPDVVLVVDRSASIGQPGLKKATLVGQLETAGMDETNVTILSPGLWYLSGGGLQSIRLQIEEVLEAVR